MTGPTWTIFCLFALCISAVDGLVLQSQPLSTLAIDLAEDSEINIDVTKPNLGPKPKRPTLATPLAKYADGQRRNGSVCDRAGTPCPTLHTTWAGLLLFAAFFGFWSWITKGTTKPLWYADAQLSVFLGREEQRPLRVHTVHWDLASNQPLGSLQGPLTRALQTTTDDNAPAADVYVVCLRNSSKLHMREVEIALQQSLGPSYHTLRQHDERLANPALGIVIFVADRVHFNENIAPRNDKQFHLGFLITDPAKNTQGASMEDKFFQELMKAPGSLDLLVLSGCQSAPDKGYQEAHAGVFYSGDVECLPKSPDEDTSHPSPSAESGQAGPVSTQFAVRFREDP